MKIINSILIILALLISVNAFAKIKSVKTFQADFKDPLLRSLNLSYKKELQKKDLLVLKRKTLKLSGKSVPVLIKVMKSSTYPDKNRWVATFLLGRIMGKKAAPFISKFAKHPSWVMRMASLKTLMALRLKNYGDIYANALKDKSLLVRIQALENIRHFNLKKYGSKVWSMLYDKQNYYNVKKVYKRTNIIKKVVRTVGELGLKEAKTPLLKMIADKKYEDIFDDMDYSLTQLTKKKSPDGKKHIKRIFWKRFALANTKF